MVHTAPHIFSPLIQQRAKSPVPNRTKFIHSLFLSALPDHLFGTHGGICICSLLLGTRGHARLHIQNRALVLTGGSGHPLLFFFAYISDIIYFL